MCYISIISPVILLSPKWPRQNYVALVNSCAIARLLVIPCLLPTLYCIYDWGSASVGFAPVDNRLRLCVREVNQDSILYN